MTIIMLYSIIVLHYWVNALTALVDIRGLFSFILQEGGSHSTMFARRTAGQAINPPPGASDTKIHLISPCCPWPSITWQCRIVA